MALHRCCCGHMHAQQLTAADAMQPKQCSRDRYWLTLTFDIWLLLEQLHGAADAQRKKASGPLVQHSSTPSYPLPGPLQPSRTYVTQHRANTLFMFTCFRAISSSVLAL